MSDSTSDMFLKIDLDLEIFDRKGPVFFLPKVFSRPLRHIERKKNSFQKVVGTPWIDPITRPGHEILSDATTIPSCDHVAEALGPLFVIVDRRKNKISPTVPFNSSQSFILIFS